MFSPPIPKVFFVGLGLNFLLLPEVYNISSKANSNSVQTSFQNDFPSDGYNWIHV